MLVFTLSKEMILLIGIAIGLLLMATIVIFMLTMNIKKTRVRLEEENKLLADNIQRMKQDVLN